MTNKLTKAQEKRVEVTFRNYPERKLIKQHLADELKRQRDEIYEESVEVGPVDREDLSPEMQETLDLAVKNTKKETLEEVRKVMSSYWSKHLEDDF